MLSKVKNTSAVAVIASFALLALAAAGVAVWQTISATALVETEADLAEAQSDFAIAEARRFGADNRAMLQTLAHEPRPAEAAEKTIAALRDHIARDAGTARDGPTAPVLEDTVRGLVGGGA